MSEKDTPDSDWTEVAEGQHIIQGSDGKIIAASLTRERAAEMGRRSKHGADSEARGAALGDALIGVLVDASDDKADALRALLRELGQAAIASNAVTKLRAIEAGLQLLGARSRSVPPQPGRPCSLCGRLDTPAVIVTLSRADAAIVSGQIRDAEASAP